MASEAITLPSAVEAVGGGHALPTERRERRVEVEQFLHRVGPHATLMVVEMLEAEGGSRQRVVRYVPWPGL